MSAFGNPYSSATDDADAYVRRLLDLVGSRDPLELLPELPAQLDELTRGLDDATLRRPEAEGKWSMLETIRHLTDSEVVFAFRYRMILGQDSPAITGYDQDSWCKQLRYNEAGLEQSFELLRVLRRDNIRMLTALTPQERRRGGMHSERGFEDIERLMRLHAAHDIVHSRQVARIRAAVADEA
jgi:hypothetical protein